MLGADCRAVAGPLDPVQGVVQPDPAGRAVDGDRWRALGLRAQREAADHGRPVGDPDPHRRGVVSLDLVGSVQLQLDTRHVGDAAGAGQPERCRGRVREGIGDHPVDHRPAVQRTSTRPGRALPVRAAPDPGAQRAEMGDGPDRPGVDELEHAVESMGAEALEPDLTQPPRLGRHRKQLVELCQRCGRWLLQEHVDPHPEQGRGELGMGVQRRTEHHRVQLRAVGQQGVQVGVPRHVGRRGGRTLVRRPRIDHGRQPSDPARVDHVRRAVAVDADYGDARLSRCHPVLPVERSAHYESAYVRPRIDRIGTGCQSRRRAGRTVRNACAAWTSP